MKFIVVFLHYGLAEPLWRVTVVAPFQQHISPALVLMMRLSVQQNKP
jgi:hypothetical protein